jgi:RHS repeat-associated protein
MNPKLATCLLLLSTLLCWLPQDAAASIPRGSYGGLQGLGGLEAVIGSDGTTRGIVNDWFGNAVGHVAAPGGAMTWSPAQFLAWGPAPGWGTAPLDGTRPLHELLGYRGLTLDPPGYIQQGLRPYDPQTGRWLSPDPVGHAGSLSLYDYCDNDPLNVFDPDGRFGKGVGYAAKDIAVGAGMTVWNAGGSIGYGALSAVGQSNLANDIYGSQWQGTKSTAAGVGGLVWDTGGSIGYGTLSAVGQNSLAQDIYGDQWSGLQQVGTAFSGGSGNSGAYRTGYTAANVAAIVLPVKAANTLRAGEITTVGSNVVSLEASAIRFSQSNVRSSLPQLTQSMKTGRWQGAPIDVVRMPDGLLTAVDNTRVAAASLSRTPVQAIIRGFDEAFPASRGPQYFNGAQTWGEAVVNRINSPRQDPLWRAQYPNGSPFTGVHHSTPGFTP